MDDWEQPSTTAAARAFAGGGDSAVSIEALEQQLTQALDRISALETRVAELEGRA
ncbi:MAG TPA: hypothetical protein VER03_23905 [Bryobacteraceae bacterium]|nr:hypothetical protein [Bryobacteraceae bacterium]